MDKDRENELTCSVCQVKYTSTGVKNRHVKKFHPELIDEIKSKKKHIVCPICITNEPFNSFRQLNKHFSDSHNITVKESVLKFRNFEEFQLWQSQEKREVNYVCSSTNTFKNGRRRMAYYCNRSDLKGFHSSSQKTNLKTGGSIRIPGVCPSRIILNILENGDVMVNWTETHVGHDEELRAQRLTKAEEINIVGQLAAGVSINTILQNASTIENEKLERRNIIKRADIAYLKRKYNIDKKMHADDRTATALKIEDDLCIDNNSLASKLHYLKEEIIEEKYSTQSSLSLEELREDSISKVNDFINNLNYKQLVKFNEAFEKTKIDVMQIPEEGEICKKIKIEKETY